jgi:signal transduction histidine kinase
MGQWWSKGLVGGAAAGSPQLLPEAPPLDTAAGHSAQQEEQDFPIIIANMPATRQQRSLALGVAVLLIVAAAVIAPFASIQVGRIDAFIPVIQTVLSVADLVTAILLFAQFSLQPQRALLAVASAYIFSGSFAFLQTLAFPGGYAPNGVIGDGPNSPAWIYVLWHMTFTAAVLVYALSKDRIGSGKLPVRSTTGTIIVTVAGVLVTIAVLTWIVTAKTEYLPSFFTDDIRTQTQFGNQVNFALWFWGATALTVLLFRGHTILDLWLMVTLLAYMPGFLVAIVGSSIRFSVGWYAARCFVLVASCMLLSILLIETMFLYSRLANAMTLQRRERTNRLLSVEAVTGAIAHELGSPLGAIALNASTALSQLRSADPLEGMEAILSDIEADSYRAGAMIASIGAMTRKTVHRTGLTSAEDVAQLVLRLLRQDLQSNEVSVTTDFQGNLPDVQIDGIALQQVLLNLVRNAIDAVSSSAPAARRLRLQTSFDGQSTVLMSVQDSGAGIPAKDQDRVFDPFFTTKSGGMGLGLAISSTLVANHGGKLRLVKSDSDGTIFGLDMPIGGQRSAVGGPVMVPPGLVKSAHGPSPT